MSIDELSPADAARARKIEALLLQRLASAGLSHVASCVGVDESVISRWSEPKPNGKPSTIVQTARFLTALGLKATPQEYRCYDERTLAAMLTFAQQRMDQIKNIGHLAAEDEE